MKNPIVALGLDAADPVLLETWMKQGHLPNLQRLRDQGAYTRVEGIPHYKAEAVWTSFLTGCLPEKIGFWSMVKFNPETYHVSQATTLGYDYVEYPPFYALGDDFQVAVFDLPQTKLSDRVHGLQVLGWGAHAAQTPRHSQPDSLWQELNQQYGEHPAFEKDHDDWWDVAYLERLQQGLKVGIERRVAICRELLHRQSWDLFLTVFSETHSAGHNFWHLSQPDHPLYPYRATERDPMLDVFQAIDRAIGELVADLPEETTVVIFSAHGMGRNTTDLSSIILLPEFLYRYNFPGQAAIRSPSQATLPPVLEAGRQRGYWSGVVWWNYMRARPMRRWLQRHAPPVLHPVLTQVLGSSPADELASPWQLQAQQSELFWHPAVWYHPLWAKMQAFALPSYSDGYIRINLQGREAQGIVAPEAYDAVCDQLTEQLHQLTHPQTGQPMVRSVWRTRQQGSDRSSKAPDADLVVSWQDAPTEAIDHPQYGRIGPVPYKRTGGHLSQGFLLAHGAQIPPGTTLAKGRSVDLTATILALMGVPQPDYLDGRSLLLIP
jgi:predicted AlkP superfamily phosphohydrolase/phosphomutase